MKNNLKIIIINAVLIIFFLISNTYSIEQFTFDITEIEISDNGNKFKGLKRGYATSDNGLKIEADIFEYDKLTNILNAYGNVKINDLINDYIIFAENISYIKNNEIVFTKGETKAIIQSKYNFLSKNVTLLRNKKELYSSNFTEIKDDNLNQYNLDSFRFYIEDSLLKGNNIELISDYTKSSENRDLYYYRNGIFNLKSKNFDASDTKVFFQKNLFGLNKSLISINFDEDEDINKNAPRIYGVSSSKEGEITKINKGTFTSCGFRDGCSPWHINAETITHDNTKKQLTYKNAFLNIYNFPVLYFPKFFHPDPSVKRQSGLLMPQINSSEILGTSIITPYFHVISDNQDLTLTPTIFDSEIEMIQTEYRQQNKSSFLISDIGHVRGYRSSLSKNKNSISHLFARYESDLNFPNFTTSLLKLNVEKVSNDTYLKIFDTNLIDKQIKPLNKDSLSSNLNIELTNSNFTFSSGMTVYESLNATNSDRYQYVLPYYNFSKTLLNNEFGNFNFSSSGYNEHRDTNVLKTSLTNDLQILSKDFFSKLGFKNNFGIYFKNLNTIGKNYSNYKSSPQSEIMSIYNFEASLPLIKFSKSYTDYFTPKVSFRTNPGDMKDYSNSNRKIYSNNIFSIDRLGIGNDSFEKGTSVTVGINYTKEKIDDINKHFTFDLATVLRDGNEDQIPTTSTIGNKSSNLIGSSKFSISENYDLEYNFSIDNNFNDLEYSNLIASYYYKNFMTKFSFIEENGKIGSTNSIENTTEIKFDTDKYLYFNTRRNRETSLTEYYDLIYEYKNDCLTASVKFKKTYYQDRDLTPSEDLLFSITLFPLSTFEQKVDQNLYRN